MNFTYEEAIDYLLGQLPMFQRVGPAAYRADLWNILAICEALGNPQQHLKCIHIAGTNGKGSVTHMIAAVLQDANYKVGVYTSPHYIDYRERIKVNGELISKAFVTDFVGKNLHVLKKLNASFFEVSTALAFQYFYEKKVDYAIIETGMGGRLDSTNILKPILSVITNISYDHQQFLGNTLPAIAAEKAGIIKEHIPVVIGEKHIETDKVFSEKAFQLNSSIYFASELISVSDFTPHSSGSSFRVKMEDWEFSVSTDLSGNYQQKNFTTAIAALIVLSRNKFVNIDLDNYKNGFSNICTNTYFMGRWMIISKNPLTIFDSAHNEAGLHQVIEQVKTIKYHQFHVVYGTVNDKDLTKNFMILPKEATYYFARPEIPRGKDAIELCTEAQSKGLSGNAYSSVKEAYRAALNASGNDDLIVVTGSIFVLAELLADIRH